MSNKPPIITQDVPIPWEAFANTTSGWQLHLFDTKGKTAFYPGLSLRGAKKAMANLTKRDEFKGWEFHCAESEEVVPGDASEEKQLGVRIWRINDTALPESSTPAETDEDKPEGGSRRTFHTNSMKDYNKHGQRH